MMNVETAKDKIQQAIDIPGIDPAKKRQLFSLFQTINKTNLVTPQNEQLIRILTR